MTFKRMSGSLLAAALLSVPAESFAASRHHSRSTPSIVISFDGAQPDVIERMLRNGKLPSNGGLAKLMREGTKSDGMTAVLPTVTATNHVTLAKRTARGAIPRLLGKSKNKSPSKNPPSMNIFSSSRTFNA